MTSIQLCIMSLILTTQLFLISFVISDQKIDSRQLRAFPAAKHSIAGVSQVTYINHLKGPEYAFNASEARELCSSLGVHMASKAQVQKAMRLGLETCRFGWTDEHVAVIPRIKASAACGQNKTGLLEWRTSVTKKFDVFCYNESDAVTQLKDTMADSPLTGRDDLEHALFLPKATTATSDLQSTTHSTSFPLSMSSSTFLHSHPDSIEAAPPQMRSSAHGSIPVLAKTLLIASACALLLIAVAIVVYVKLSRSWDVKQQEEHIETEEWTICVKGSKKEAQEEDKTDEDNNNAR
uniref:Lymphatic vessel endothelial hyaluronic receptor 1a n=2 Tax=Myripristis murdjan TaxID=586833 RepID=A0A667ZIT4_9TELE